MGISKSLAYIAFFNFFVKYCEKDNETTTKSEKVTFSTIKSSLYHNHNLDFQSTVTKCFCYFFTKVKLVKFHFPEMKHCEIVSLIYIVPTYTRFIDLFYVKKVSEFQQKLPLLFFHQFHMKLYETRCFGFQFFLHQKRIWLMVTLFWRT